MSLTGFLEPYLPDLGINGSKVRPVNEGDLVSIVGTEGKAKPDSFWSFLDDVGTEVKNGLGDIATAAIQDQIDKLQNHGPETSLDTTGIVEDQVGLDSPGVQSEPTFIDKYKMPMLVAAAGLVAILVIKKI